MGMPKVSVIIPCYNCERWIEKCLDAIIGQDYEGPIEILCVDDCSTDQTVSIIKRYACSGGADIRLLTLEKNTGPANARNTAITYSTGKWIAFCDTDDWYEKNFISTMVDAAERDHSEIVMCNYKKVLEASGRVIPVDYLKYLPENPSKEQMLIFSKASFWLLLVKRELMMTAKIPELRNGEDIAAVPILEAGAEKITCVHQALYNYMIRSDSASNASSAAVFQALCHAYRHIDRNLGDSYQTAREYLGIRTLLYGATMNGFKANVKSKEIASVVKEFQDKYPRWYRNPYMSRFSPAKRVYLLMIRCRGFLVCRILSELHRRLSI